MSQYKAELRRLFTVTIAVVVYVFGVVMFIVPAGLYTGGLNGYAVLIKNVCTAYEFELNLGILVFLINVPAYILGYFSLTKRFMFYSVYALVLQSVLFGLVEFDQLLVEGNLLASSIFGGLFMGIGVGLSLRKGAALGGLNIINQVVSIKRDISIGSITMVVNGGIIILAMVFFNQTVALYTFLGYLMSSIVVDKIHTAYKRVKLEIITEKGDEVKEMLLHTFAHGMTILDAVGGYTNKSKQMIFMVAYAHEAYDIKREIIGIDPNAYITKEQVHHMSGKFKHVHMN